MRSTASPPSDGQPTTPSAYDTLSNVGTTILQGGHEAWNRLERGTLDAASYVYRMPPDPISKAISEGLKSAGDFLSRVRVTDPTKLITTIITCGVVVVVAAAIISSGGTVLGALAADPVHGAEAVVAVAASAYLCYQGLSSGAGLGLSS